MNGIEIMAVDRLDRGIGYGEGCFETVRVIDGEVFRWPAHVQRLAAGLGLFGIVLPESDLQAIYTSVLAAAGSRDAMVRITVTGGLAPWGLLPPEGGRPATYIQSQPFRPAPIVAEMRSAAWPFPLKLRPAKLVADYAEELRAMHLWRQQGVLAEGNAPLLLAEGRYFSALTANVLFCRDGEWLTPPLGAGVLPGVVRQALLESGIVREADCDSATGARCEAVALCNSGQFIQRVGRLDGRLLDSARERVAPLYDALGYDARGSAAGLPQEWL